ncbi:MAG TPA: DUF2283 domain-containing protein [Pyrinomonadaceae bacterium]|nr:DUF2283 domain-containing protein [Pyrinomonadaceae bacterium]
MTDIGAYLSIVPAVLRSPHHRLQASYEAEGDVLYINFKKPSRATDSELTDDDVVVRYEEGEVVGLTILRAGTRS